MSNKKPIDQSRMLDEMMEMARALQGHALISRQDMAKMKLICQTPPEYTSEKVTYIQSSPDSARLDSLGTGSHSRLEHAM